MVGESRVYRVGGRYHPRMTSDPWVRPLVLEGEAVRLEPLAAGHHAAILEAARDPAIWRWMPVAGLATEAAVRDWAAAAELATRAGTEAAFATIDRATGLVVGSTRYLSIVREHRRLEIGWTWLTPSAQGTAINPESKLLLVGHAIERLGARRGEVKTDARNETSRAALLAIGATFEGILRRHMILPDGSARDSAYYSIVDTEWPTVRERLAGRVRRRSEADRAARG